MKNHFLFACLLLLTTFYSCQSNDRAKTNTTKIINLIQSGHVPNYDYKIDVPPGWATYDTFMQNIKVRYITAPASLDEDKPRGNIVIGSMEGMKLDVFTTRNMSYLKSTPDITLLERGNIRVSSINAQWFRYTRVQNGVVRDMINYIIPVNGFAYLITFGTNKGAIEKYRPAFDQITQSLKV